MIVNRDNLDVPDAHELGAALRRLYAAVVNAPYQAALPYVLPDDPDFPKNPEPGFWYVEAETLELRRMSMFLSASRNVAARRNDYADAFRTMVMEYLLIVEADFPAFAILNALRFHQNQPPVAKFSNSSGTVCPYPKGRFKEIATQAQLILDSCSSDEDCTHAAALVRAFPEPGSAPSKGLFSEALRNAVAHAHFRVQGKTRETALLHLTRDYSFLTRTAKPDEITGARGLCTVYTYDAMEALLAVAKEYCDQADQLFRSFEMKLRNPDVRTIKWRLFQARA